MAAVPEHPSALDLADAAVSDGRHPWERHLAACVECRIRTARLARAGVAPSPSGAALDRVLGADGWLPRAVLVAAAQGHARAPAAGELWRVGAQEALLVWVRKIGDGVVDVMPVTLDTDLADDTALLLPADATALGMELAILTSLRSLVHPDAFLTFVAELPVQVTAQAAEVLAATEQGRRPEGVVVGGPVHDSDDQRIEYQQTLADVMADLAPAAWLRSRPADGDAAVEADAEELFDLLSRDLVERHSCHVNRSLGVASVLAGGAVMRAVARVGFADSSIIVALLQDWQDRDGAEVALASGLVLTQEAGARAVAVCTGSPDWQATVVSQTDTRAAIEIPGGKVVPPRTDSGTLQVVDAVAKYLELQTPMWEDVDDESVVQAPDLVSVARTAAVGAIANLAAQGKRAQIPAKKQAWTGLPSTTPARLVDLVRRIVEGEEMGPAVDRLFEDGPP